jgi:hypothetical protein
MAEQRIRNAQVAGSIPAPSFSRIPPRRNDVSQPRAPKLYEVPPGTIPRPCNGPNCRKDIHWIKTPKGASMPIDCAAGEGCVPPTSERPGSGVPHWGTCPDFKGFKRPKAAK